MGPTALAPTDLPSDQVNNCKTGKNKDCAIKGEIRNNAPNDFVGIVVFSGAMSSMTQNA